MKAFLISISCEDRQLELNQIKEFLIANNFSITTKIKEADLIVFSTCAFAKEMEKYSLKLLRKIESEKKHGAKLVVCGCLPKINKKTLDEFNCIKFGPDKLHKINDVINAKRRIKNICYTNSLAPPYTRTPKRRIFEYIHKILFQNNIYNQFYIKISTGCLENCSFCVHKRAIGNVRSKPINLIIKEFIDGLEKGYKQFYLAAEDAGCYGIDIGTNLVELLKEMTSINGNYKIAIEFIHPKWLIKYFRDLKKIFRTGKVNYLCSPAQSGSNRILKLMNRDYKIESFVKCVKELNNEFPEIILATDFIVGFPGENEDDFQKSLKLVKELNFQYISIFKYSEWEGTKSYELPNKVPEYIKELRYRRLFLAHFPKKIRFILDITHPYGWLNLALEINFKITISINSEINGHSISCITKSSTIINCFCYCSD